MRINGVYIKKLKVPIYQTGLWIVVSDNILKSIDVVEDLVDYKIIDESRKRSTDAYTYGHQDHDGKMRVMIFLRENANEGRVAHECNHAVNIILNWNGVKPSFVNDESECYYLEYMVNKTHQALNQYKKI